MEDYKLTEAYRQSRRECVEAIKRSISLNKSDILKYSVLKQNEKVKVTKLSQLIINECLLCEEVEMPATEELEFSLEYSTETFAIYHFYREHIEQIWLVQNEKAYMCKSATVKDNYDKLCKSKRSLQIFTDAEIRAKEALAQDNEHLEKEKNSIIQSLTAEITQKKMEEQK